MKYKITLLALLSVTFGFGQNLITKPMTQQMSKGAQPGITVFISNVSEDNVEDAIKDVMKPFNGKNAKIKRSDEFFLDDASIPEISVNTIDIHQIIAKADNGYSYTAFFDLGGLFLDYNYSAEKFDVATGIVRNIALKANEYGIEDSIKTENNVLDDLEKNKKELVKDAEKLEKEIEKAKDLIKDNEKEIQEKSRLIESKRAEIEQQRQKIIVLQNLIPKGK